MNSKKWGKFVELADRATDMFQPSLLRILQLYLQQNKSLLYYRCLKLSYRRWCFSSKVWTRRKFINRFEIENDFIVVERLVSNCARTMVKLSRSPSHALDNG
ncbi:hypothetical protein P5673_000973 [Acropora cervicornis]|uniref:Uncharacterized protein n=1 Tax=Acropora cervicornis TaxID=6130 RepID=A0AAD9R5B1_ACRCE|nr:hypothetical protein P5673_000973 [Acropora cervicornis]